MFQRSPAMVPTWGPLNPVELEAVRKPRFGRQLENTQLAPLAPPHWRRPIAQAGRLPSGRLHSSGYYTLRERDRRNPQRRAARLYGHNNDGAFRTGISAAFSFLDLQLDNDRHRTAVNVGNTRNKFCKAARGNRVVKIDFVALCRDHLGDATIADESRCVLHAIARQPNKRVVVIRVGRNTVCDLSICSETAR